MPPSPDSSLPVSDSAGLLARWGGVLVLLAALLAFQPALHNQLTFDDVTQVTELAPAAPGRGLGHALIEPWWPPDRQKNLWRPLTRFSLRLEAMTHGTRPDGGLWLFYAINGLLHGLVSVLLWMLARRWGMDARVALLAGLLFAVHPLHSEAVQQVAGRAELLAALGMAGGLYLLTRWGPAGRHAWWQQPLCLVLALGGKEHAALYPLLVGLAGLAGAAATPWRGSVRRWLGLVALLAGIVGLFLAGKYAVTGGLLESAASVPVHENPLAALGVAGRTPGALGVFGYAVGQFLVPGALAPDYSRVSLPLTAGWGWSWAWWGLGLTGMLVALAVEYWRRGGRGWALILGGLAAYWMTGNLFFTIGVAVAERLWYWPSAAACLGLAWGAGRLAGRLGGSARRAVWLVLLGVWPLALLGTTWDYAAAWRSPVAYAEATLARFPGSWRARVNLAREAYQRKDFVQGMRHARAATAAWPEAAVGWDWLGMNAMFVSGRGAEAEAAFRKALALDPLLNETRRHWANLLESQGRAAEAAAQLEAYLQGPGAQDRAAIGARIGRLRAEAAR